MKVYIDKDERWPDYIASKEKAFRETEVEMSEEDWNAYNAACNEYEAWQDKLEELYRAATK